MERVAEMLLVAGMLTALAAALLALMSSGLTAATRWIRQRRSLLSPGEGMFVARWGREGPELFVVGTGARRLLLPQGGKADLARREVGELGPMLAARMLAEILARRPSRELAGAFAEERLTCLPAEGLLLPTSEVIAWLDARHAALSGLGIRAVELAAARAGSVASWFRPATRPTTGERVPDARDAARGHRRENRAEPPLRS